jgi:putative nucleotidyltransferase with HDIG domain
MPAWIGAHHTYKGGLLKHVYSVTKLVMLIGKTMCEVYGKKINMDHLIAAAMLHDLAKVWQLEKIGDKYQFSPYLLDHAVWSACELYARGFPEEIVHMVSTHGGESGGPVPKTLEATILFHADNLDASAESAAEKIILLGEGLSAKG